MIKQVIWALASASLVVGMLGCSSPKTDTKASPEKAATQEPVSQATPKKKGAAKTPAKPASGAVDVTKKGSKFDLPISKDKVPDGAYYCDMGTVHYARMEEGDGKCPLCGMALKHKASGDAKEHSGHQHGDHEHGDHAGHGSH